MIKSASEILLSIPHCSLEIPPEIKKHMIFTQLHLKRETDLFTDQLFDLEGYPALKAQYSRYVVDLNRSTDTEGEKGVIVTTDFDLRPIYLEGQLPSSQERQERIEKYWKPYHQELEQRLKSSNIRFFIDAHSMRPVGSAKAPDAREERADIVLSNLGTPIGKTRPEIGYLSCPWEWLLHAAEILEELWRSHPLDIAFNDPYYGGYILQHYSHPNCPGYKKGFQIEINRKLYLNWETQEPLAGKIEQIHKKLEEFLERFMRFI